MKRLADAPASAEELKARKSVLIGSFGRNLATTDGLATTLGNLALYDLPLTEVERLYPPRSRRSRPPRCRTRQAHAWTPEASSVIVAGDAKAFEAGLKSAAAGPGDHPGRPARPGLSGALKKDESRPPAAQDGGGGWGGGGWGGMGDG